MPPGLSRLSASCSPQGPAVALFSFEVIGSRLHRTGLSAGIPSPWEIEWTAENLAVSGLAGLLILLLLALPGEVFNSTLAENYDEVRAWFRRAPRTPPGGGSHRWLRLAAFMAAGGILYAALSTDFGFNLTSAANVLGMTIAVLITTIGFGLPADLYMRRRFGEWGRLALLPGSLVVSVLFVALSKTTGLQPGILYGLMAGFTFRQSLEEREDGKLTAAALLFVLLICGVAWVAGAPVAEVAGGPDARFGAIVADSALAGTFVMGLESLLICLIPVTFLAGRTVIKWSRLAWGALCLLSASAFVMIFLIPDRGFASSYAEKLAAPFVILAAVIGLCCLTFWAYFRFRPQSWVPSTLRTADDGMEDLPESAPSQTLH